MPYYGAHGHRAHAATRRAHHVARRRGKSRVHRHRHGYHLKQKRKGGKHPHRGAKRKKKA